MKALLSADHIYTDPLSSKLKPPPTYSDFSSLLFPPSILVLFFPSALTSPSCLSFTRFPSFSFFLSPFQNLLCPPNLTPLSPPYSSCLLFLLQLLPLRAVSSSLLPSSSSCADTHSFIKVITLLLLSGSFSFSCCRGGTQLMCSNNLFYLCHLSHTHTHPCTLKHTPDKGCCFPLFALFLFMTQLNYQPVPILQWSLTSTKKR